mmetsp:Transcript_5455/g.8659  ORF Transcript_5455/g.8659 Transcript_5455/m.8659 type:complete len:239 (+) Transcript_5455:2873-3589(+)
MGCARSGAYFVEVMAVGPDHFRAKLLHLGGYVADLHDRIHGPVTLLSVHIHDGFDVIDLVVGTALNGFPCLTFLHLAVGHIDPDFAPFATPFAAPGKARSRGQTDAERAVMDLHAGGMFCPDHLDTRAVLVEHLKTLRRHASDLDQRCISDQRIVCRRDEQPVEIGGKRPVIAGTCVIIRVIGMGHAPKGLGNHRQRRLAQIKLFVVEPRQLFCGGTCLAQIAAIVAHRMLKNATADT